MKVIIAGSRNLTLTVPQLDYLIGHYGIEEHCISEVVSGKARGVDTCGEKWAAAHHIAVAPFPFKTIFGKQGGIVRNREMADYADVLMAFLNDGSGGTMHMINHMSYIKKKPTIIFKFKNKVYDNVEYREIHEVQSRLGAAGRRIGESCPF